MKMRNTRTAKPLRATVLGIALAAAAVPAVLGQGFVKNPSFESNLNSETPPLAAGAPQGWPYYSAIDDWTSGGGGVNDLVYDPNGPFHNGGTPVPDGRRVGFKQGGGAVSQDIAGLTPGKRYWIQFRYDARNGSDLDLGVKFSTVNQGGAMDEVLDLIPKVRPARATSAPYYSRTVPFTPDAEGGTLSFEVTARGDSTVLLDAVGIVQRDEGNFPVINPSFEASGVVFNGAPSAGTSWPAIGGWAKTGVAGVDDGTGGKADNGKIPDQALAVFVEGEGSLAQTLSPLVVGENYEVQFAYNARSGTPGHLQLKVDDTVAWEQDVAPVGGTAAYRTASVTFKAAVDSVTLGFSNTLAGATVLLDNVRVLGKLGTRLPPMEMAPAKILLRVGEEGSGTVTIPAERLTQGPAVVKIRSANTAIFTLPEAAADGVLSLSFQGVTSRTYKVLAAGIGSAAVEVTDTAGLLPATDSTSVFVAGTTLVLNPSFELDKDSGVGTAAVAGWTTGGGNIGMAQGGNPFLSAEDLTIPDRAAVLRMQGGGMVSQTIQGLETGRLYGLQFFYNGRSSGYPYEMSLEVRFAGQTLATLPSIKPASQDGLVDYYFRELRFTPAASSGLLEFKVTVASGDATLFLDAVSLVPRLANEIAVVNSSFEGSAMGANWPGYLQPTRVAGWVNGGGGYGVNQYSPKTFFVEPFLDNGINSDQDNAFFGQGAVTMKQTLSGLAAGQAYTLVFDYNFRDGRAQNSSAPVNTGVVEVSLDGSVLFTSDDLPPVDTISPFPGFRHTKPFYQAFVPLTPGAETAELQIAHTAVAGDETMLIDNVRLLPGTRTPPTITRELADQTVAGGARVTFTVAASGSNLGYRWYQDGVRLVDGNGIAGSASPTLTLAQAQASSAGTYSALASDGVGVVGSSAVLTVEVAVQPKLMVSLSGSTLRITSDPQPLPPGFVLQIGNSVTGPWSDQTGVNTPVETAVGNEPARFLRAVKP